MKRTQQQYLQASQSPLMCALAIIIHIPRHPIAEGQCLCARFSLSKLTCSGQVSCATHRRTDEYVVTEKVLLQLWSDSVCHHAQNASSQQQVPCRGASSSGWHRGKTPGRYAVMAVLGQMRHHVEGCGLLSSPPCQLVRSVYCLVWILWGHHEDRS